MDAIAHIVEDKKMEVTKIELKILIKEFLSASNRVLRAGYEIYSSELSRFIRYIESQALIYEYIKSCGAPEYNVEDEVKKISESYGHYIFTLGSSDEKEVANIYAVVKYLAENNYDGLSYVYFGYSSSNKYQEKVNSFGNDFIKILIIHIENYLTRISIQMGLDEKTTVTVNIENSTLTNAQVCVASEGSSIVANQNTVDADLLQNLINDLLKHTDNLNSEDQQTVNDCIETISTINEEKPKKGIIRTAIRTLKGIVGTAEFIAAVTAIAEYIQNFV